VINDINPDINLITTENKIYRLSRDHRVW